jgi:malonyl-CoA O-methyltransferase
MLQRLDYVKLLPRRILDAGSGPSPQASRLARRYRGAQLVALDFSVAMLGEAQPAGILQRLAGRGNRIAVCADISRIPLAPRSVSMVWSNMALHWAADLPSAMREFHRVLEVDGLLMFSTLGPDTLRELRSAFAGSGGQRHVHGFIDMHDLGDMLVAAGFAAPVMDTETITLTYAGIDAMIADLRATGQTCALDGRPRGLLGARRWQRVREALEKYARDGRLPATFEVVYGHAWKPAPRLTGEGHAIIKMDKPSRLRN